MNVNWDGSCHIVVFDDDDKNNKVIKNFSKNFVDMHSHGLKEVIGIELQYIINVGMHEYFAERVELFYGIAEAVLTGDIKLEDKAIFQLKEWGECKFKFYKTKDEAGEDIFRVVECDMNGKFPEDKNCKEPFKYQYCNIY